MRRVCISSSSVGPVHTWVTNLVIIMLPHVLAPEGVSPSAGRVLTLELEMVMFSQILNTFSRIRQNIQNDCCISQISRHFKIDVARLMRQLSFSKWGVSIRKLPWGLIHLHLVLQHQSKDMNYIALLAFVKKKGGVYPPVSFCGIFFFANDNNIFML